MTHPHHESVLLAEDDADDRATILDALAQKGWREAVRPFEDGQSLMDFLHSRTEEHGPLPARLLVLDLNMPRKHGFQVLRELKAHPILRRLPVAVFTTSSSPSDVDLAYELGANAYVVKPGSFRALAESLDLLFQHWLKTVQSPR